VKHEGIHFGGCRRRGFTLVELMVVIFIIAALAVIAAPAVTAMLRGNAQSHAVNLIRAQLATARSVAISQHRQAGVIFFEESTYYMPHGSVNTDRTAMQLIVESADQSAVTSDNAIGNTVFVYHSRDREYLPAGIQIATLNDDPNKMVTTSKVGGSTSRIILFDANGQLVLRNRIVRPDLGSSPAANVDPYPWAYGDWLKEKDKTNGAWGAPNENSDYVGVSAPALLIYNDKEFSNYCKSSAYLSAEKKDVAASDWVQRHADVLVVNAYTGNLIR